MKSKYLIAIDAGAIWFDIEDPKLVFAARNSGVIYESKDSGTFWSKK